MPSASLAMFFMWAGFFGFPRDALPRYAALFRQVAERPAFKREGLASMKGKGRT